MSNISAQVIQQLSAANAIAASKSAAVANASSTQNNSFLRVVVSQVSASQVALTNPESKKTINIPSKLIYSLTPLSVGQSFALLADSANNKRLQLIGLSDARTANTGMVVPQQQSQQVSLAIDDQQLKSLVGKLAVNAAQSQGLTNQAPNINGVISANVSARVESLAGNILKLQLQIPGTSTALATQLSLPTSLPANFLSQLSSGTALTLSLNIGSKGGLINAITLGNQVNANNSAQAKAGNQQGNTVNLATGQQGKSNIPLSALTLPILQTLSGQSAAKGILNNAITLTPALIKSLPHALQQGIAQFQSSVNAPSAATLQVSLAANNTIAKLNVTSSNTLANVDAKSLLLGLDARNSAVNTTLAGTPSKGDLLSTLQASNAQGKIANMGGVNNAQQLRPDITPSNLTYGFGKSPTPHSIKQAENIEAKAHIAQLGAQATKSDAVIEKLAVQELAARELANSAVTNSRLLQDLVNNLSQVRGLPANKVEQVLVQLQSLLAQVGKQSLQQSGSATQVFQNLSSALAEQNMLSPETQQLIDAIKEKLPQTSNNTNQAAMDANSIRQLFTANVQAPPINALSPTAQSGILSGLMTLLQVSLASRLQKQSNQQASRAQDAIPDIVKDIVPKLNAPQSARLMQEFNQFDSRHLLTAEIAKLLSAHAHNKILSAQNTVQGQDTFYYVLPNLLASKQDDIELLIKREAPKQEQSKNDVQKQSQWMLSMKLSVGEQGEMLVKTQLQDNDIKLQVYTSSEALKIKVLDMLPFLQRRLSALGINMIDKSCQQGKVPASISPANYQIFETLV